MDQLCEITSSKRIFAADYVSEGVPFYRGREVTEKYKGNLDVSTELFITEEKFVEFERKFGAPKLGDLLLTSVGTLGSVYVVKPGDRFYFKDGNLTWFRNFKGLDSQFLFYWIGSPQGKAELQKCTIGSSQSAFTIVLLKGIEIALPTLPVQQRIATILSAYDELIENSQRRIKILETMARSLYREWFVRFRFPGHENHPRVASAFGDIPQGWEVKRVTDAMYVNPRVVVSREGEKPFVPMSCLSNDSMLITDVELRTGNSGTKFQNGDTLFARITPCLENGKTGYVQFLPDSAAVAFGSTEYIVLRSHTLTPEFVYCMSRSDEFRGIAIKSMSGATGRQRVQEKCFDDFLIAQAPKSLLDQFAAIVSPSFKLIYTLHLQIQNLRRTRDLLLPRLLSGQIAGEAP
jgi:type I restriction enzyme S subunit